MLRICKGCNKEEEHHGKGYCYNCYRKFSWKPKKEVCKRCKREMYIHAKGVCPGCYQFIFHLERNKAWNKKKYFGIDFELYKKLTKKCIICNFDKIVELHHLDENNKNNSEENLTGLCPNHHNMLHDFRYRKEMRDLLTKKCFNLPKDPKLDFKLDQVL